MNNEEDIIEAMARELCSIRGLDPDEQVQQCSRPSDDGFASDVYLLCPRWRNIAIEVKRHLEVSDAVYNVMKRLDDDILQSLPKL